MLESRQRPHPKWNMLVTAARVFLAMAFEEHNHCWHQRSGNRIGRENGEYHGFGQRYKEVACHSRERKHWNKNNADAEGGNHRGQGNLTRAL